jgi:hypothetical protein
VILGLLTLLVLIAVLTGILAFIVRGVRRLLYVHEVRHMRTISELQARANAAPLTSAVINRLPGDNE